MEEITLIHVVAVTSFAAIFGFIFHIGRAVFNVFPDKISDSAMLNLTMSSDYNLIDHLFGVEFDTHGFYELYSLKNLRISMTYWAICCFVTMVFLPDAGKAIVMGLNYLWDVVLTYLGERLNIIMTKDYW
jgi:hypothetical protein